jgi:hypothetical protein
MCSELLGFWTLSIVQYSNKVENTVFRKLVLFLSSGEGGRYLLWVSPVIEVKLVGTICC